jgi:hypothetical protein
MQNVLIVEREVSGWAIIKNKNTKTKLYCKGSYYVH